MLQSWSLILFCTFSESQNLRISALFSFSFHPLPYLLNPALLILLVLSCPTTLSGSHVVTRACQLSTVPGITDQRTEGTRWAGQQRPSVHEGTWTVCSSLARAIEGVKNLPATRTKTQESWRPLYKYFNPTMDTMKCTEKYQGIWHRQKKIHVSLCYRKEPLGIRPSFLSSRILHL